MFDYAKLAVLVMQGVLWLMNRYHDQQSFDAGQEAQVVIQAKAVLALTTEGKQLLEKINALSDSELDDLTDAVGGANKSGKS